MEQKNKNQKPPKAPATKPDAKKVLPKKPIAKKKVTQKPIAGPLIYQQIPKVMRDIDAITKDQTGQGYKYRGIDDIYNEIHGAMAEHGVFTVPIVLSERTEDRERKGGGLLIYRILKIRYVFYAEDGSRFSSTVIGEAFDTGDKAANKSMSAAHKYALLQVFCIPTEEKKDSENDTYEAAPSEKSPAAPPKPKTNGGKKVEFKLKDGQRIWVNRYDLLKIFGEVKKEIGDEIYYKLLKKYGYEKSNEIKTVLEYQRIYNDMMFAAEVSPDEKPAKEKVDIMSLTEAADKAKKLMLILVDKFKVNVLELGPKLKQKFNVINLVTMDPDQADGVIGFLEKEVKRLEKAAKEAEKKMPDKDKK